MCRMLLKTGEVSLVKFREALALMKNGGPDSTGINWKMDPVDGAMITFGHNRLKIRDLSPAGDQPMSKHSFGTLLYNGEIYNQADLEKRARYPLDVFKGDTEFLYNEIVRLGLESAVGNVNIEGAVVWIEESGNRIKIYRDSRGTKTLYWYLSPQGQLGISSEIKPILALFPGIEPYKPAVKEFLHWGYNPGSVTLFTGVFRLNPAERIIFGKNSTGNWIIENRGKIHQKYFGGPGNGYMQIHEPTIPTVTTMLGAIPIVQKFLSEAVKRRMISDVPVSCTLSGGIDSSIMAYLMKKHYGPFFKTYTLEFKEDKEGEADKAQRVADWLGVKNERITISSKNILAGLDDIIRSIEEPCDKGSLIPTYFLSRGIEEKVSLIGEGADEIFLGYSRYKGIISDPQDRQPVHNTSEVFRKYYDCVPPGTTIRKTLEERRLVSLGIRQAFNDFGRGPGGLSFVDRNTEVPNYHCVRIDKLFMRFGHEARLPYLDEVLVNRTRTFLPNLDVGVDYDKKVLREAFRGEIPDWILDQPKKALKIPYDQYVQMPEFKEIIYKDYLRVISKAELDKLYKTYETGEEPRNRGRFLWLLVLLNKWYEQFYGNKR